MTSKEALEKLLHSHICYDCTAEKDCCKTCDSRLCYEAVKKDLEVLEALKENYSGAIKRENNYACCSTQDSYPLMTNDMDLVDARDAKVKEWLTNDK